MKKKLAYIILLLFIFTILSSCLGSVSLDKYGYVLTLGVDKGTTRKYNVIYLLESESQGGEDSAPTPSIVSAEGDNIFDSIYAAESGLPFSLNFSRTGYVVIGFDVAADDEISEFFSVSWSGLRLRTSSNMIVSSSTAMEFMEGLTDTGGINIAKLESSLTDFYERDGLVSMMSIAEFLSSCDSSRYDPVLPLGSVDTSVNDESADDSTGGVPRKGGMTSYTLGSAVFSGSQMRGVLSARESRVLLLTEGKMRSALLQFTRDDGTNYTAELSNDGKPRVKVKINDGIIRIRYDIGVAAVIRQDSSREYSARMQIYGTIPDEMKEQICDYLQKACITVFDECTALGCDSFGTGKYVSMLFKSADSWEKFRYKDRLGDVICDFSIRITTENAYIASYYSD